MLNGQPTFDFVAVASFLSQGEFFLFISRDTVDSVRCAVVLTRDGHIGWLFEDEVEGLYGIE